MNIEKYSREVIEKIAQRSNENKSWTTEATCFWLSGFGEISSETNFIPEKVSDFSKARKSIYPEFTAFESGAPKLVHRIAEHETIKFYDIPVNQRYYLEIPLELEADKWAVRYRKIGEGQMAKPLPWIHMRIMLSKEEIDHLNKSGFYDNNLDWKKEAHDLDVLFKTIKYGYQTFEEMLNYAKV